MSPIPKILVFDSGLGGLTVLAEVIRLRPDAACAYLADDAVFPYGQLPEAALVARVEAVIAAGIDLCYPDVTVIACHTASTLVLPVLRARWPHIPFVGTVPAIKPGAQASRSRKISVLATPGTVARDYTHTLVQEFASHCQVKLVGCIDLASLAERFMQGQSVADADILAQIAPAFVADATGRTDVIVLACTHYPLVLGQLQRLAPWEVQWIDPAPAIARRVDQLLPKSDPISVPANAHPHPALFTAGGSKSRALQAALQQRGLDAMDWCLPA